MRYITKFDIMRKFFAALALTLALCLTAEGQMFHQPLTWMLEASSQGGDVYEITATGTFSEDGWHIYDMADYGGKGPNSTVWTLAGASIEPLGEAAIISPVHKTYDEVFGMEIGTCDGPVVISQKVRLIDGRASEAEVTIEWQCCNDSSCIPPTDWSGTVLLQGASPAAAQDAGSAGGGIWALILEAILWGLAMLLTPCVFPMVPMTVSFFMKGSESKAQGRFKAAAYGIFIVLLYTVPICIIIGLTWLFGGESVTADIFNWLATHWLPNILFFIIFMAFAASFFGAFELTLPSRWVNSSDQKAERKGLGGIFFLALTLVLVSFSCTGPIVGTVLIKSTRGEFWTPMVTMLAFSVAFALPFALLALFPSMLKNLPKSGGWLNCVKVVLGFIEIALGFKFLSTADQTYHWHLLDREVYLAIWIVVFTLLGLYLLGKIRFANDSPVEHINVLRLGLAITVFSFVVYMVPGMWGAPLKALSGYLPPITTQDFVLDPAQRVQAVTYDSEGPSRKYSDFLEMPYDIPAFFDYEEARAYAAKAGKPLFIDFTGHGCVNCREMETRVWSDPRALKMMREDYVVCSLFADDKKTVDEADWVTTADGKVLKTLGKINSYFALTRFNVNAQPYYAILDPVTEEHKVPSRGYNLDVDSFVKFLQDGLQ